MTLKDDIKKLRPKLSDGSLNTYASLLKTLYKNVFDSKEVDMERFNKDKRIFCFIFSVLSPDDSLTSGLSTRQIKFLRSQHASAHVGHPLCPSWTDYAGIECNHRQNQQ